MQMLQNRMLARGMKALRQMVTRSENGIDPGLDSIDGIDAQDAIAIDFKRHLNLWLASTYMYSGDG